MLSKSSTFSLELMNGTLGTSDIRVGMHNGMKKVFFHFDTPAFSRDVSSLKHYISFINFHGKNSDTYE